MGEDAAQLVILHATDEGGAQSKAGHPHDRVGGRPAGDLHGRAHRIVNLRRLRLVD